MGAGAKPIKVLHRYHVMFLMKISLFSRREFRSKLMIFMACISYKINDFHEMKIWKNTDESQKHAGLCPFHGFFSLDLHVKRRVILM